MHDYLIFRQGKPPTSEPSGTVRQGYLEYLQSIAQGICKPNNPFLLDALLREAESVAFPDQPGKVFPLTERRQKSEAFYWEQIRHHLSDKFASLDMPSYEVLVGGGVPHTLLKPRLDKFFKGLPGATVNWLPKMSREVCSMLGVASVADQARFADCYGGAKWLALKFAQSEEAT